MRWLSATPFWFCASFMNKQVFTPPPHHSRSPPLPHPLMTDRFQSMRIGLGTGVGDIV